MQHILRTICLFVFAVLSIEAIGQVTVSGKVHDKESGQPVPYATVAIVNGTTDEIATGTTTNDQGIFSIQTNLTDFYVEVSFIGYEKKVVKEFDANGGVVSLGTIVMESNALGLDEVEITAEKSTMEFKLDKRVFNVGKDISNTGMGALDVLDNVPSVNVDIEGQITLRGNSGVQILIDGKPSVLADQEGNALGTITADMIESVEVITNPSAKYEAEGTSGILNIILKKEEKKGFNGSISANAGYPANHSVGVSLNRRTEKFNLFTQFGAGYRSMPNYNESRNEDLVNQTVIESDGTAYRNEAFYNITLGSDYYLTENDVITLSGNFAFEDEDQPSETDFEFFGESGVAESAWRREESTQASNPKYQYDLQYKKDFKKEDHVLMFSTLGSFFGKEQKSDFTNTAIFGTDVDPNQKTETNFYQRDFTFKLDYTNPISDRITVETGALYEINDVGNDYAVFNEENGIFVPDYGLTNDFEYVQKVLGVYGTGSYEGERWGVKVGLRVESTDLNTLLVDTDQKDSQNYTDFFPSVHTSYKINEMFSLQAGYSRRIFRPRLWDLNPFFNIRNNYNIRRGNPKLQPEYADSYEVTGIFIFEKVSLNASAYYLYTTDVRERVSFSEDNVTVTMPINIGTNDKIGLELNGKYSPEKWLTFNWDFNYGYFDRKGSFEDQSFDFTGDQWSAEITTKIKLPAKFTVEVSGNYRSEYETVQGDVSGFAFANAGLRKDFMKGKLVASMGVRDIFASRFRENYVYQPTFNNYSFSQRGTFFTLGLSYGFGKGETMTYSGRRR